MSAFRRAPKGAVRGQAPVLSRPSTSIGNSPLDHLSRADDAFPFVGRREPMAGGARMVLAFRR